ncbi:hypothetical protein VNO78_18263 [Psophocarpus tetragonolobus]|uniref:Alpha/beta hydrolase fold-3 domain-containing protein n=1 Tax=Psophocarpus tetragonolobus TaxID=3891 RepID=A0AAN9SIG8_PSOTE
MEHAMGGSVQKGWLSHCNMSSLFLTSDSAGAYNVATRMGSTSNIPMTPLPLRGATRDHPYCNPLAHGMVKLRGLRLPSIMACVSEMDILRDRNLEFSNALVKAGKRVETVVYKGAFMQHLQVRMLKATLRAGVRYELIRLFRKEYDSGNFLKGNDALQGRHNCPITTIARALWAWTWILSCRCYLQLLFQDPFGTLDTSYAS